MKNAFKNKNAFESASCWSKIFFSWTSPVLEYSKKNQLKIEELGKVRPSHDVRIQQARLVTAWNYYKHSRSKYSMFKAVLRAYRYEYIVAILWSFVVATLQLSSPFLLRKVIVFIRNQEDDTFTGIMLVLLLSLTQGLAYLISEHINFYATMTGCISTNAMIAMIYDKTFKISSATNKKFSQGQLVNFVQVDALKLQFLSTQAPMVMQLPILIIVCFVFLFYYLQWSFIAGAVVFVITFLVNTCVSRKSARLQKKYMPCQDARIKAITESLNNIKMLKLYAWRDVFLNLISEKRAQELEILK